MSRLAETLKYPTFLPSAFEEISQKDRAKAETAAREQEKRAWCTSFSSRAQALLDTKNTKYSYGGRNVNGTPYDKRWETDEVTIGEGEEQIRLKLVGVSPGMYLSWPRQFSIIGSCGQVKNRTLFYVEEGQTRDWAEKPLDTPEQRQQADEALVLFESLPDKKWR